jgi:hypothetical protein
LYALALHGTKFNSGCFRKVQKQGQPQAAAPICGVANPAEFRDRHTLIGLLELRNKRPEMVAHIAAPE